MILSTKSKRRVSIVRPRRSLWHAYVCCDFFGVVSTHWDGDRTTLHVFDGNCECDDARERRTEGFVFCVSTNAGYPFLLRLTDSAVQDLYADWQVNLLRPGARIELTRSTPHPRAQSRCKLKLTGEKIFHDPHHEVSPALLEESLRRLFRHPEQSPGEWLQFVGAER